MFRKNTTIPKQQITCPACGHSQRESVHAISTICQNCNRGIAIALGSVMHTRPRVQMSSPAPTPKSKQPDIKAPAPPSPWSRYFPWLRPRAKQLNSYPCGVLGNRSPHPAAHKMIACQSCQKLQAIAHGIWETHCIHCGSHTNLRDYAIDTEWHKRIQTRGNVHIKKHAVIRGVAIECHDLFCEGVLHGSVHCTGKLEFHNSSTIIGKIICQQLEIHPTCYIHSAAAIQAHSALILGQLRGSLHASGGVTLEKSAILHGNITAANIRIRPGARHVGSITIQNTPSLHTKNKTQK